MKVMANNFFKVVTICYFSGNCVHWYICFVNSLTLILSDLPHTKDKTKVILLTPREIFLKTA